MGTRYQQKRVLVTKDAAGDVDRVYVVDGVYSDDEFAEALRELIHQEQIPCEHRVVTAVVTTPSEMVRKAAQVRQEDQVEEEAQLEMMGCDSQGGCPNCEHYVS